MKENKYNRYYKKPKDYKNNKYLLKAIFPEHFIKGVDDPKKDPVERMQEYLDKH